ncbi:magnesium transporter [Tuber brumale]|nr:magnesium transporter [Tuber brumale]
MASGALISLSSLLLIHSCYSAHEHSLLMPTTSLPLDVAIETLVSVVLLCLGIVLGNREELKPISWSVWSGLLEREKGYGQFGYLEERVGFLDIRAKRAEFVKWVKVVEEGSSS